MGNEVEKQPYCFFYVVHGDIIGFPAGTAFRRVPAFGAGERRSIHCPYCGGRLVDAGAAVKVELYRLSEKSKTKCHFYIKCHKCKDETGIILV